MSRIKHTALPWEVDERFKTLVKGAPGYSVATTGGYSNNTMDPDELNDMLEANARHIVHCVNNYDRLREALSLLTYAVSVQGDNRHESRKAVVVARDNARALLAELDNLEKQS